jgi:hypothetical protein
MCLCVVAVQMQSKGEGFFQFAVLFAGGVAIVLLDRVVTSVARRREAERRRREAAALARKF